MNYNINDLLKRIGAKLQLDDTRREKAINSYKAVSNWLDNDNSYFRNINFDIYPQGSFAIQTSIKPIQEEEYDLDFIMEIDLEYRQNHPLELLNALENTLRQNNTYDKMLEKKTRCIRLNYANDFHLDILPACPSSFDESTNIKIPDRQVFNWLDSNPKGFAQWFENKSNSYFITEKMAQVEEIPTDLPYEIKPILKVATQLIKRHRDIYFENKDYKPRSIVLTTLAGMYYQNEIDIYATIMNILNSIVEQTQLGVIAVYNPVDENENFTDRWKDNPEEFNSFKLFVSEFLNSWKLLLNESNLENELQSLFGETISSSVIKEAQEYLKSHQPIIPKTNIKSAPKPWST